MLFYFEVVHWARILAAYNIISLVVFFFERISVPRARSERNRYSKAMSIFINVVYRHRLVTRENYNFKYNVLSTLKIQIKVACSDVICC